MSYVTFKIHWNIEDSSTVLRTLPKDLDEIELMYCLAEEPDILQAGQEDAKRHLWQI